LAALEAVQGYLELGFLCNQWPGALLPSPLICRALHPEPEIAKTKSPTHQSLLKAVNKLWCKWGRKDDTNASWSSRSKEYLDPQVLIASIFQRGRQYHPTSRNQEEALHSHFILYFQTLHEVRMRNSRRVQQCEKAYIGRRSIRGNVFAHVSKFASMDCCCSSSHHRWRRLVSGCTESKRVSLPLLLLRIWSSNDPSSTHSSALHHVGLFAPPSFRNPSRSPAPQNIQTLKEPGRPSSSSSSSSSLLKLGDIKIFASFEP
jgi:hypothetical protein